MRKILIIVLVVSIALALGGWWRFSGREAREVQYRLAKVEQRDLRRTISATGTLMAVVTVEVGSEISGRITELLADYNSKVKKDQIIARLDPQSYQALVRQAEAELALAQAKLITQKAEVERCQADLLNARSKLTAVRAQTAKVRVTLANAKRELERRRSLVGQNFISKADFDAATTAFDQAQADLEEALAQEKAAESQVSSSQASLSMAQAQIKEAEAQIELKAAALDNRQVDLERTVIRSPVDGVVIDRSVDVGQTVAASLQAPTLFTIAQDLSKMEVSTSVDEADIGTIKDGQPALFTVDAFGARKFLGQVTQIRKAAQTVQNVVTYTVIISADNEDLSLMPGMTANVEIVVLERPKVLAVLNAALRFQPPAVQGADTGGAQASVKPGGEEGRVSPEERVSRLSQALGLSPEQQAKLKEIQERMSQQMKTSRQVGFGPERSGPRRDQARKQFQAALMGILSSEQKERYQQYLEGRQAAGRGSGRIWGLDQSGRPTPIQVVTGISDGAYTEISGTGVESGMDVLVGLNQAG